MYDGTTATATPGGAPALLPAEAKAFGTGGDGKPYTGDSVSVSGSATGSYNSATVAGAGTVTFNGLSTANGNYSITAPTQAATITPKALNYTGISAASKAYDGTATAALSGTAATLQAEAPAFGTGGDGKPYTGDTVSFTTGTLTGAFASQDVANGIAVTVTGGVTLAAGGQSADYSVGSPNPALKANITQASSATALVSSANPSLLGSNVTFKATVSSTAGTPTGEVVFKTNGVPFSTIALVSGIASASTTSLPVGTNTVTAEYAAQGNYLGSTGSVDQVVSGIQTPITVGIQNNRDGSVTVSFSGTPGAQYIVQASGNVGSSGAWTNVSTNTAGANGHWTFTESADGHSARFYRSAKP